MSEVLKWFEDNIYYSVNSGNSTFSIQNEDLWEFEELLKKQDKEIERLNGEKEQLNSLINNCQEEIRKLRNRINNTVEYINNPSYFDGGYMTKHDLLMLLSGTIVKGHSIRDINKIKKQLQELKGDSSNDK